MYQLRRSLPSVPNTKHSCNACRRWSTRLLPKCLGTRLVGRSTPRQHKRCDVVSVSRTHTQLSRKTWECDRRSIREIEVIDCQTPGKDTMPERLPMFGPRIQGGLTDVFLHFSQNTNVSVAFSSNFLRSKSCVPQSSLDSESESSVDIDDRQKIVVHTHLHDISEFFASMCASGVTPQIIDLPKHWRRVSTYPCSCLLATFPCREE